VPDDDLSASALARGIHPSIWTKGGMTVLHFICMSGTRRAGEKASQASPLMKSLGSDLGIVTVWPFPAELLGTGDGSSVESGISDLY
jgi:hypothetical protein